MRFDHLIVSALGASWSVLRTLHQARGPSLSLHDRLAMFPTRGLSLRAAARIHWSDQQVPFIEADHDADLPFVLGLVHAHLRLGQMEIMRRIARGRVSEMAGPAAIEFDRLLRSFDFGRTGPAVLAAMPPETRAWLDAFVAGINEYLSRADPLPFEFEALALEREPWSAEDVLALGRLVSADINWLIWFRLLAHVGEADWLELWCRLIAAEGVPPRSPAGETPSQRSLLAANLFQALSRRGSNSLAIAASRSATGGALLASDPHLGIQLPNWWLVAGYRSPSHNAVGLMIPGLPLVALGRNRWIAWGATNLHAASSDLCDVSELPAAAFALREERLRVRWSTDCTLSIREAPQGPVVSDLEGWRDPLGRVLALRWVGHRPSDEMTALLRISQARSWAEYRAAAEGFAVPGQALLYADIHGHIGQLCAAHLPRRAPSPLRDLVQPADEEAWRRLATSRDLPASFDPPEGVLVSANNRPPEGELAIGYFFSTQDRMLRIRGLLANIPKLSVGDLAAVQQDVLVPSIVEFRDRLLNWTRSAPAADGLRRHHRGLLNRLAAWDGRFAADSPGALAIEQLTYHLARALSGRRAKVYWATWRPRTFLDADIAAAKPEILAAACERAFAAATRALERYGTWGSLHRVGLSHLFGVVPLWGRYHRYAEFSAAGNSESVMKTAYGFTARRHRASYGSVARHISDLSDPDRNHFALLGGQDGWPRSTTFLDQLPAWQEGRYIAVPLSAETANARFPHKTELRP
jgi:penicillin amidase